MHHPLLHSDTVKRTHTRDRRCTVCTPINRHKNEQLLPSDSGYDSTMIPVFFLRLVAHTNAAPVRGNKDMNGVDPCRHVTHFQTVEMNVDDEEG